MTILDSNLSCKNSTNCFGGKEQTKSNSSSFLDIGETGTIDNPTYSMNVIIKRLSETISNETYESDTFLCPNLAKVC